MTARFVVATLFWVVGVIPAAMPAAAEAQTPLNLALPRDESGHAALPEVLYRPYRLGTDGPAAFFRDHTLSDRIGFHYQSWDAEAAADDFVERVREAGRRFSAATCGIRLPSVRKSVV